MLFLTSKILGGKLIDPLVQTNCEFRLRRNVAKLFNQDKFSQSSLRDYPASRGPSIFLDKSGRGRDLCQPPRLSLICRSSTETDESVRFETCFSRFCSVRMCLVRNCWLNTRPRYVWCACEVHSSGRFSFERCLR